MPEWVVLLEAAGGVAHGAIDACDVRRLQESLDRGPHGGILHSDERYALQVTASGATPVEALFDAVARWSDAVRQMGLAAWKLVRTEVFTPEDLQREFERAECQEMGAHPSDASLGSDDWSEAGYELLRRAFADPLTGLLGHQAFDHRLETALRGRRRPAVAVVGLDLDALERGDRVVDGATEDEVLIAVARRLAAILRPGDALARLGGHQYGVLLEDSTEEAALGVAQRLLDAAHLPVTISGRDLPTGCASAGVAVGQPGESAAAVIANAGAALGAAKAAGGGDPVLWGSDLPHPGPPGQDLPTAVLQDRLAHVQLLQQATVAANESDTLHRAARVVMRHICSQVGCAVGHLWAAAAADSGEVPQTSLWHVADGTHRPPLQKAMEELVAGPGAGLRDRVLATGRPEWISDLAHDDALVRRGAASRGMRSAFAFPVVVRSEAVAVLSFVSRTPMERIDSFVDVLAAIGIQLGRVVERERGAEALRLAAEQLRGVRSDAATDSATERWMSTARR